MAGDGVLADFRIFETEAWEQRQEGAVTNMLYSPKCLRGSVAGRAPRTPAQALHWSNHLTALLLQLPNYG